MMICPTVLRFAGLALAAHLSAACSSAPQINNQGGDDDVGGAGTGGTGTGGGSVATGGGINVGGDESGGAGGGPTSFDCGNGELELGELCDDGNEADDDGCSGDCQSQDLDYDCSEPGEDCVLVVVCGNGVIEGTEVCDPGDAGGDGCASDCKSIEDGWACPRPGKPCVEIPVCGDGTRQRGEECDAGPGSDPGCVDCVLQPGYYCGVPGTPCLEVACPNGELTPGEACDDGDGGGDGCTASCTVEAGWRCQTTGCRPICGDGVELGDETCDDGDDPPMGGDGCSASCRVEPGYACPTEGATCVLAQCGNGVEEPGEGCDDGDQVAGDGCGPTCQDEPTVTVGPSPVVNVACGDGLITGSETCDDGNTASGDGCSASCAIENGFLCDELVVRPDQVEFQVTYRNFEQRLSDGTTALAGGHPHMRRQGTSPPDTGTDRGIAGAVCTTANGAGCGRLSAVGKPVWGGGTHGTVPDYPEAFAIWFDDNAAAIEGASGVISVTEHVDTLVLEQQGGSESETYRFEDTSFWPLDDLGNTSGQSHNFHFTTELRYFLQYQGGETLTFRGDDDVFVYVNGRLAVDIGGIHGPQWGRVVLGDDGAPSGGDSDCSASTTNDTAPADCELSDEEEADDDDDRFGLTKGEVYEIVLFHAERQPTGSNFVLTLAGFLAPRSFCEPDCGDGKVRGYEACDDGDDNADGVYGVCNTTCSARQFCGDGILQSEHEACDNGFNVDLYDTGVVGACTPQCELPGDCGDGVLQADFEFCDDGDDNDDDLYEGCNTSCEWGPYCGDGDIQEDEQCDDGFGPDGNTSYSPDADGCGYDCAPPPFCGDGVRNGPEECDLGTDDNVGGYGGCKANCELAARCGDLVVQGTQGEECDAGPVGNLDCSPTCQFRDILR